MADSIRIPSQDVEHGQNNILHKLSDVQLAGPADISGPIMRLPNEILAEIFHQGHISSGGFDATFRSSICLVGQQWRNVAISTSSLWTHLLVKPGKSQEFILMYLQRSKDRPLVVCLEIRNPPSPGNSHSFLHFLTPSANRWRELIIFVHDHELSEILLQPLCDLKVPLLEAMKFSAAYGHSDPITRHIFTRGAPRLSNVYCGGVLLHACWPPMDKVTTFRLAGHDFNITGIQFYEMLDALPSVTNLLVQEMYVTFRSGDIQRKIHMPSLRRLMISVGRFPDTCFQRLLSDVISAPNLETLVVVRGWEEIIEVTFASLAAPPLKFPALTSLELWHSFSSGITRDVLQSLPNLKELTCVRSGDDLLRILADEDGGPLLLPHLHTLAFSSTLVDRTNAHNRMELVMTIMDLLNEFVATRARLKAPIQRLKLDSVLYAANPECIRQLQERVLVEDDGDMILQWS